MLIYKVYWHINDSKTFDILTLDVSIFKNKYLNKEEYFADELKINTDDIIKCERQIGKPSHFIKEEDYFLILMSVYSSVSFGTTILNSLGDSLEQLFPGRLLKRKIAHFKANGKLFSGVLKILCFNKVLVDIIKVGEDTGNSAITIREAANYIQTKIETDKASKTGILASIFNIIFALSLSLGVPNILAPGIQDIITNSAKTIETNIAIDFILYISHNFVNIIILIFTIFVVVVLLLRNNNIYKKLTGVWPINIFDRLNALKLTLVFLPLYLTLSKIGVTDRKIAIRFKNINHLIGSQILFGIDHNNLSIQDALEGSTMSYSSPIAKIISIEDLGLKHEAGNRLVDIIKVDIARQGKKIAGLLKFIGMIFLLITLFIILSGLGSIYSILLQ